MLSLLAKATPAFRQISRAVLLVWESSPGSTLLAAVTALGQGVTPLFVLYAIKRIIDAVVRSESSATPLDVQTISPLLFALLGALILAAILRGIGVVAQEMQAVATAEHVQRLLHAKAIALDLEIYENPRSRDVLHRARQEAPHRPVRIVQALTTLFQSAVALVALGGLFVALTPWWLTTAILLITISGILFRMRISQRNFSYRKKLTPLERRSEYYHWVLTAVEFAKEVRLFNLGTVIAERAVSLRAEIARVGMMLSRRRALTESSVQVVASATLVATFAWMTLNAHTRNGFTVGLLVLQIQALQRGMAVLQDLAGGISSLYDSRLFLDCFDDFMAFPGSPAGSAKKRSAPAEVPTMQDAIRFENVSFAYANAERKIFDGLNLEIRAGEMVALVGENGAGKSTLIKLLCGLYRPTEGRITVDGIDLRQIDHEVWWRLISALFQDYNLYCATVAENIWFGDPPAKDDGGQLRLAAQLAGASEFIEKLPEKYDQPLTLMFENGAELSLGQWQKIALARTFFRQAELIVLDEPNSSLDVHAEREVFNKFKLLAKGKTSIVISHRLSTVRLADRILCLQNGRLVEDGPHENLITQGGVYAGLFEAQASSYR